MIPDMTERFEVQRTIPADAAAIFRVVCDPQGHVAIDASGMLQSSTGEPAGAVGDTFVIHMDRESLGDRPMGKYDVTVTSGRTICSTRSCRATHGTEQDRRECLRGALGPPRWSCYKNGRIYPNLAISDLSVGVWVGLV